MIIPTIIIGGGALWWIYNHPIKAPGGVYKDPFPASDSSNPGSSPGGIIPPQDFPGGISYPSKNQPTECHVEVPPLKPKLPPKGSCEEALSQCMSMASSGSGLGRFGATLMCATGYLACKKMFGGDH